MADAIITVTIPEAKIPLVIDAFGIDTSLTPTEKKAVMTSHLRSFIVQRVCENEANKAVRVIDETKPAAIQTASELADTAVAP